MDEPVDIKDFPQVSFSLNPGLDVQKFCDFLFRDKGWGGSTFRQDILAAHPALEKVISMSPGKREAIVEEYVRSFYQREKDHLGLLVPQVSKEWSGYALDFFQITGKIFPRTPWPKGEYKGFLSVSHPWPRYLVNKTFQMPTGPKSMWLETIAHELLHFIFYEHIRLRYTPQLSNTLEGEMNALLSEKFILPLWELAEVFNIALLTRERFGKGGDNHPDVYPTLEEHGEMLRSLWQEVGEDIDVFFSKLEKQPN